MRIAVFGDSLTYGMPGSSYFARLRRELPDHTLYNFGEGNDTVVSLYRRISRLRTGEPFDLAFLWIGVNDVGGNESLPFRLTSLLQNKPRAKSLDE